MKCLTSSRTDHEIWATHCRDNLLRLPIISLSTTARYAASIQIDIGTWAISMGLNAQLDPSLWVERYGDYLYRYALSRLHNSDSAEEVVQETFVAALRARDQFSGRGAERAWLLGILKRKIVDLVRKRARLRTGQGDEMGTDPSESLFDQRGQWRDDPRMFGHNPLTVLENREFWQVFRACLGTLPEKQSLVFSARELDGQQSDEICKEMEITASNLWVLLHRARLGLMRCLKSRWQQQSDEKPC